MRGLRRCRIARRLLLWAVVLLSVTGCTDQPRSDQNERGNDAWWILARDGLHIADAAVGPDESGRLWVLEYTFQHKTLQIGATARSSSGVQLAEQQEQVGTATVSGFEASLRRGAGLIEGIPPSVFAVWRDGDVMIGLGGSALDEAELRDHLRYVQRVDQARWNEELRRADERNAPFRQPPVTTRT